MAKGKGYLGLGWLVSAILALIGLGWILGLIERIIRGKLLYAIIFFIFGWILTFVDFITLLISKDITVLA
jgi:hypothetical protein